MKHIVGFSGGIDSTSNQGVLQVPALAGELSEGESVKDPCEWNPFAHRAAIEDEAFACGNQAELIVGANGEWRICRRCWEQDRADYFWRYRVIREVVSHGKGYRAVASAPKGGK